MTRPSPRVRDTFVRMWRIVVLLRCQPHTIAALAIKLGVCPRTIRRDLIALRAVPLPVDHRFTSRKGVRAVERDEWFCGEIDFFAYARDQAESTPARFTPSGEGKAIGSA